MELKKYTPEEIYRHMVATGLREKFKDVDVNHELIVTKCKDFWDRATDYQQNEIKEMTRRLNKRLKKRLKRPHDALENGDSSKNKSQDAVGESSLNLQPQTSPQPAGIEPATTESPAKKKKANTSHSESVEKKKPSNAAFILYSQHHRAAMSKQHPEMDHFEIRKELGKCWKELSKEEKAEWKSKADGPAAAELLDADKSRPTNVNGVVPPAQPAGASSPDKAKKKRKNKLPQDPNKPKRTNPFIMFANERRDKLRAANPDFTLPEIGAELGRMWRELTEVERQAYIEASKKGMEQYEKDMAAYNEMRQSASN